ncbi:MAG TPA: caspase family protein [Thermodesulfobacteriota bacterium]|nr:caspase family protein [Thermodesulfobacteriota bacterium]
MAKGIALNLGLNAVDPKHYGGWAGELNACEADADDMAAIAKTCKFQVTKLLTKSATRARVIAQINKAARTLKAGDIFLLTYSGHGGQLPDINSDEADGEDETWCLYDGELVDDELFALWKKFPPGVRILVLSDSCHSGTVTKLAYYQGNLSLRGGAVGSKETKYRAMPPDVALRTYRKNKAFYDRILKSKAAPEKAPDVKATVLLVSGCQDNQLSSDGDFNGLFTGQLLKVWKNGAFKGSYKKFCQTIVNRMPPDQTPNYFIVGASNPKFEAQKPFTV